MNLRGLQSGSWRSPQGENRRTNSAGSCRLLGAKGGENWATEAGNFGGQRGRGVPKSKRGCTRRETYLKAKGTVVSSCRIGGRQGSRPDSANGARLLAAYAGRERNGAFPPSVQKIAAERIGPNAGFCSAINPPASLLFPGMFWGICSAPARPSSSGQDSAPATRRGSALGSVP